jgi:hypothetical protein
MWTSCSICSALLGTVPFTPITIAGPYTLNGNNVPGQAFINAQREQCLVARGDYQATRDTLLYANVSRGYKAGSFPSLAASIYQVCSRSPRIGHGLRGRHQDAAA